MCVSQPASCVIQTALICCPAQCGYSLLGLGDIVIPGLLLSLMIRIDYAKKVSPFATDSYFLYSCFGAVVSEFHPKRAMTELHEMLQAMPLGLQWPTLQLS